MTETGHQFNWSISLHYGRVFFFKCFSLSDSVSALFVSDGMFVIGLNETKVVQQVLLRIGKENGLLKARLWIG